MELNKPAIKMLIGVATFLVIVSATLGIIHADVGYFEGGSGRSLTCINLDYLEEPDLNYSEMPEQRQETFDEIVKSDLYTDENDSQVDYFAGKKIRYAGKIYKCEVNYT